MGYFNLLLIYLLSYSLSFWLIQCAPGKKSFAAMVVAYIIIAMLAVNALEGMDGPGGIVAYMLVGLLNLGAIVGILTKAVTLYMARKGASVKKRTIVRVGAFLSMPILLALYVAVTG